MSEQSKLSFIPSPFPLTCENSRVFDFGACGGLLTIRVPCLITDCADLKRFDIHLTFTPKGEPNANP